MSDLHTLLASVEKAEGPDRELDGDIAEMFNPDGLKPEYIRGQARPYTASIDASLALVERMLPGWCWGLVKKRDEFEGYVHNNELHFVGLSLNTPNPRYQWFTVRHKLPALALLAALLRALIAKGTEND